MSKTLHLTLKKKWFDMIASGEKKEEYREIKNFWASRLAVEHKGCIGGDFEHRHKVSAYRFRYFDTVIFKNGYAKDAPTIVAQCLGIEIGEAKPEWSDNWQGKVFIIKLGQIL